MFPQDTVTAPVRAAPVLRDAEMVSVWPWPELPVVGDTEIQESDLLAVQSPVEPRVTNTASPFPAMFTTCGTTVTSMPPSPAAWTMFTATVDAPLKVIGMVRAVFRMLGSKDTMTVALPLPDDGDMLTSVSALAFVTLHDVLLCTWKETEVVVADTFTVPKGVTRR